MLPCLRAAPQCINGRVGVGSGWCRAVALRWPLSGGGGGGTQPSGGMGGWRPGDQHRQHVLNSAGYY